jgi:hypothetical protein
MDLSSCSICVKHLTTDPLHFDISTKDQQLTIYMQNLVSKRSYCGTFTSRHRISLFYKMSVTSLEKKEDKKVTATLLSDSQKGSCFALVIKDETSSMHFTITLMEISEMNHLQNQLLETKKQVLELRKEMRILKESKKILNNRFNHFMKLRNVGCFHSSKVTNFPSPYSWTDVATCLHTDYIHVQNQDNSIFECRTRGLYEIHVKKRCTSTEGYVELLVDDVTICSTPITEQKCEFRYYVTLKVNQIFYILANMVEKPQVSSSEKFENFLALSYVSKV